MGENTVKIGMISLGCPKNQVDAELMLARVNNGGFKLVQEPGLADIVIINTCGFIESAKAEAIEEIMEMIRLKEEKTIKHIIVTGCLAERYREQLAEEFPEIDGVLGLAKNGNIVEAINTVLLDKRVIAFGEKGEHEMDGERLVTTLPFYAYLRVADGCNNNCSYCAIPMIRGKFRSKTMESLIKEANTLADGGVKELILVAQDTTRYGQDLYGKIRLTELLDELCKIEKLHWIRLLYCYPERMTDELIETIASQPKIVKYIEIPIQHCNKRVLRSMHRPGDADGLRTLFKKLRERIPNVTLRTTVIAGMPGETEEEFTELAEFLDEIKFDRLGAFAYSQEEDTAAADYPDQLDDETKERRAEIIMEQQMNRMVEANTAKIGQEIEALCEGFDRYADCFFGRSAADAPDIDAKIFFTHKDKKPHQGDFVTVKINDVMDLDLLGEMV